VKPTLHLTVGLPGVGKTTRAKELAAAERILRLTPDDWMIPLFSDSDGGGKRDVLEGRMIWVAQEVLRSGVSVILDFGCWSPDERYALRAAAEAVDGTFQLHHLTLDEDERRERTHRRWLTAPDSQIRMTDDDHARVHHFFMPPSRDELVSGPMPAAPEPFETWSAWASDRWPSLPRFDQPSLRDR